MSSGLRNAVQGGPSQALLYVPIQENVRLPDRDTSALVAVIESSGGLPIVPAFWSVGSLMLWTGPGTRWNALPATELFRLALHQGVAAVVVDGAGPEELYLQRKELVQLLESERALDQLLASRKLLLPLPPIDPPETGEMLLVPGARIDRGDHRQLVLRSPVLLEDGHIGLPAFTTTDSLARFCAGPCESSRLPADFLIRSILATPVFGALVVDAAGPERRELRGAELAAFGGLPDDS